MLVSQKFVKIRGKYYSGYLIEKNGIQKLFVYQVTRRGLPI